MRSFEEKNQPTYAYLKQVIAVNYEKILSYSFAYPFCLWHIEVIISRNSTHNDKIVELFIYVTRIYLSYCAIRVFNWLL